MSERSKNVDVVRSHLEAFERDGLDAAAAFWHPDIDWQAVEGAVDDVGVIRGAERMRHYYADWIDTVEDLRPRIERVVFDEGETLVVVLHQSGRGRGSDVPMTARYTVAYTIRDGLIVRGREYETPEDALAALGDTAA